MRARSRRSSPRVAMQRARVHLLSRPVDWVDVAHGELGRGGDQDAARPPSVEWPIDRDHAVAESHWPHDAEVVSRASTGRRRPRARPSPPRRAPTRA